MTKPREWWADDTGETYDAGKCHVWEVFSSPCENSDKSIHVIEHAAYQALLAESMKLREALKTFAETYETSLRVLSKEDMESWDYGDEKAAFNTLAAFDKFLKTLEG